jgi:hypothetical protein
VYSRSSVCVLMSGILRLRFFPVRGNLLLHAVRVPGDDGDGRMVTDDDDDDDDDDDGSAGRVEVTVSNSNSCSRATTAVINPAEGIINQSSRVMSPYRVRGYNFVFKK